MTAVFGIVGDPIAQVRSPEVFNALFREQGVDAVMVPLHVTEMHLPGALWGLHVVGNVRGLIVTVPHKVVAARLARRRSDRAAIAGAANALRPGRGGWEADLFDGEGFATGIEAAGMALAGCRCAVMGAGGAGAAIALALADRSVGHLSVWDVDGARAAALARRLSAARTVTVKVCRPDATCQIVVNATPMGMAATDPIPINLDDLSPDVLVAEAVMKPSRTRLLEAAAARGMATHEGHHMLDNQVQALWRFFGLPG